MATLEMNKYCLNKSSKIENSTHLNYLIENEKKVQDINRKNIRVEYTQDNSYKFISLPGKEGKTDYIIVLDSIIQNNSSGVIIHEMKHIAEGDCDERSSFLKNNFQEFRTATYTFKRVWENNH